MTKLGGIGAMPRSSARLSSRASPAAATSATCATRPQSRKNGAAMVMIVRMYAAIRMSWRKTPSTTLAMQIRAITPVVAIAVQRQGNR